MESPDFTCSGINCSEKKNRSPPGQLHVIWTKRCTSYLKIHLIWDLITLLGSNYLGWLRNIEPRLACVAGMLGRLLRSAPLRTVVVGSVCVQQNATWCGRQHKAPAAINQSNWQDHLFSFGLQHPRPVMVAHPAVWFRTGVHGRMQMPTPLRPP